MTRVYKQVLISFLSPIFSNRIHTIKTAIPCTVKLQNLILLSTDPIITCKQFHCREISVHLALLDWRIQSKFQHISSVSQPIRYLTLSIKLSPEHNQIRKILQTHPTEFSLTDSSPAPNWSLHRMTVSEEWVISRWIRWCWSSSIHRGDIGGGLGHWGTAPNALDRRRMRHRHLIKRGASAGLLLSCEGVHGRRGTPVGWPQGRKWVHVGCWCWLCH